MTLFMNVTETIGVVMNSATTTTTGSLFAALLIVLLLLVAMAIMFRIPLEFIAILVLPYNIACASHYSNFIAPMGAILIYLSIILTKNFIFK